MKSTFVATLRKSGNSLTVTVPKAVADLFQFGEQVRVNISNEKQEMKQNLRNDP